VIYDHGKVCKNTEADSVHNSVSSTWYIGHDSQNCNSFPVEVHVYN